MVFEKLTDRLTRRVEQFMRVNRPPFLRYVVSLGIGALGLFLFAFYEPGNHHIYLLSVASCQVATLYGGFGPGLLVSVLTALIADYFYVEPIGSVFTNLASAANFAIFLVTTILMSLLMATLRSAFRRLEELKLNAEAASRSREEVLAVVSHDLRNPLSSILLGCQLLRRVLEEIPTGSTTARRPLENIENSARQMNRLILDLLDAASIDLGHLNIRAATEDAASLVRESVEAFELQARAKELILAVEVAGTLPAIQGDRQRLIQVFSNLLGNAVKFTPPGGRITVSAEPVDAQVRFRITDTGPGISPSHLTHIFERHWQAKETAAAGSGLGLFIARGIVEAHGGAIQAESRIGAGASFCFTIPVKGRGKTAAA